MVKGITVVTPAYGDVSRLMNSIFNQYRAKDEDWKIEVIIANDNVEDPNYENYYKNWIDKSNDFITVRSLNHKEEGHWYQGIGRQKGIEAATYDYVLTIDSDDEYLPYTIENLIDVLNKYTGDKKIACVGFDFLSYDKAGYFNHIGRDQPTIWVQSRLWNKQFVLEHRLNKLYEETIVSSKRGEDYPWVNLFDYYLEHEKEQWEIIMIKPDSPPLALWTPNQNSFSRQDPYYGQMLAGYTMGSSLAIYSKMKEYNKEKGIDKDTDEYLKHRILNMNIYAFFNLYDFIWTIGITKNSENPYIPKEHHWKQLRDNVKQLRKELLVYYNEIQDNDIINEYWGVLNRSDARIHNTFEGTFFDYMKKGCRWFNYDYNKMLEEVKKLDFDAVNCLQSPKVKAWKKRHN